MSSSIWVFSYAKQDTASVLSSSAASTTEVGTKGVEDAAEDATPDGVDDVGEG